MNVIKAIDKEFSFLYDYGFRSCSKTSNLDCCVTYFLENTSLLVSYDYRTHMLDVYIDNKKVNYGEGKITHILDSDIGTSQCITELKKQLKEICGLSKFDWTISKKHLIKTVQLYAHFIEANIGKIINT